MIRVLFESVADTLLAEFIMSFPPRIGDKVDLADGPHIWRVVDVIWCLEPKMVDPRGATITTLKVKVV